MILPIRYKADWALINASRQKSIDKSNTRENACRLAHQYSVGDKALLTKPGIIQKMTDPRTGPYKIKESFTNGTVSIKKGPVSQIVNIRQLTPYYTPNKLHREADDVDPI
jgi:hypothetical protein